MDKNLLFLETSAIQFHKCVFRQIRVRKQPKTFKKIVNKLKNTAENVNQEMMMKKAERSSLKNQETKQDYPKAQSERKRNQIHVTAS